MYHSFLLLGCKAYGFLSGISGTSSILTLAAVAIDRYLVISRPLDLMNKPTRCRAYTTICIIWLYSATFASMPLLGVGKYVPEGFLTSCSFDYVSEASSTRAFIFSFFVAAWLCPLSVIAFCYIAIVRAVYNVRQNVTASLADHQDQNAPTNTTTGKQNSKTTRNFVEAQNRGTYTYTTLGYYEFQARYAQ